MSHQSNDIYKILILHGPNLNMLGSRDPKFYGRLTLDKLNKKIREKAKELNISVKIHQFNSEEKIINSLHRQRKICDGIVINPAAFTHYSYAIRDAIELIKIPVIEVHLSDIYEREDFRKISVTKDVCIHQIYGKKENSYLDGLKYLVDYLNNKKK